MRLDKLKAYKLRVLGKSYGEINKALGIPKATLSDWFAHLELSEKAKEKIQKRVYEKATKTLIHRNIGQTQVAEQKARKIRNQARKEIKKISKRELWLLGVLLYWTEGYKRPIIKNGRTKTSHAVSMTNSDPEMIKLFLRFLREVCHVPEEKISANVRIHAHQNEGYILNFWNKVTKISPSKLKSFYYGASPSSLRKRPFNILPYGTIQVRVNSTELYHRIMGWIEGLQQS